MKARLVPIPKFTGDVEALKKFFEANGCTNVVRFLTTEVCNTSKPFLDELQMVMDRSSDISAEDRAVIEARYERIMSPIDSLRNSDVSKSLNVARMVLASEKVKP